MALVPPAVVAETFRAGVLEILLALGLRAENLVLDSLVLGVDVVLQAPAVFAIITNTTFGGVAALGMRSFVSCCRILSCLRLEFGFLSYNCRVERNKLKFACDIAASRTIRIFVW